MQGFSSGVSLTIRDLLARPFNGPGQLREAALRDRLPLAGTVRNHTKMLPFNLAGQAPDSDCGHLTSGRRMRAAAETSP